MSKVIKKQSYLLKQNILIAEGIKKGLIVDFDEKFYEQMSHTYVLGIPVSIEIKYLKDNECLGKCDDRSLSMFVCFEESILVSANNKDFEVLYGKEYSGHWWIEMGEYVYDPSRLKRYVKDLYYKIYMPTNIHKWTKYEYCLDDSRRFLYERIKNTTIEDYQPGGKNRMELLLDVPIVLAIAKESGNKAFMNELNSYLESIQFNIDNISEECNNYFKR